jgi:hypothetical protein
MDAITKLIDFLHRLRAAIAVLTGEPVQTPVLVAYRMRSDRPRSFYR